MPVNNRIAAMKEEVTEWRRDFHEHPELQYDVHRTAGIVAEKLKAFGCDEVTPGIGRTGVVAVIKGRKQTSGKVIGMRADMDALPLDEILVQIADVLIGPAVKAARAFLKGRPQRGRPASPLAQRVEMHPEKLGCGLG